MLVRRPYRALLALAGAALLAGPVAPVDAASSWRVPSSLNKKIQRDLNQKVQRDLQPLRATEKAWKSYVHPKRGINGAPPAGSLGPSPQQIAARNHIADPEYWKAWWQRLRNPQGWYASLPVPTDFIKPELFLPIVPVPKGPDAWVLEAAPRDIMQVRYTHKGQTRTVAQYLRTTETDAVVVLHNGRLVSESYANGYSATQPHQLNSATKSFTSALIGMALHEGRIASLADPIERYLPELAPTAWAGTTIRNILEMESGIAWDGGEAEFDVWENLWWDYISTGKAGRDRNEFLMRLPREAPQGTAFHYNSGNTMVLGWLLETVYGRSFPELLSERLWKPMGMEADASIFTDRHGRAVAHMGLYAVARDLARFGELFRNGGRTPDGRQIVPEAWVRESTDLAGPDNVSGGEYAYQWWRNDADPSGFSAAGFQGQLISVSPSACTVGVRFGHTLALGQSAAEDRAGNPTQLGQGGEEFHAMLAAVNAELGGCPGGG